jgi:hypothetical protein
MVLEHNSVYDEFAYFLASLSPRRVVSYQSSAKSQTRVAFLIEKNKNEGLSAEESAEMERFMAIEHIVRLAKSKALQKINAK